MTSKPSPSSTQKQDNLSSEPVLYEKDMIHRIVNNAIDNSREYLNKYNPDSKVNGQLNTIIDRLQKRRNLNENNTSVDKAGKASSIYGDTDSVNKERINQNLKTKLDETDAKK